MPNFPGSLPSATPVDHGEVIDEIRAIADVARPGGTIQQQSASQVVRTVRRAAGLEQTTDANLEEFRNSDNVLVHYINEEGFPRTQNSRNSKTVYRIRNGGTGVNFLQFTNSVGDVVYFQVAGDGTVTAPNIGIPIRIATGAGQTGGILNAGQTPAGGDPTGVYLRRTT